MQGARRLPCQLIGSPQNCGAWAAIITRRARLGFGRLGNHLKCGHARIASFARLPEDAAAVVQGGFERQVPG